MTSPSHDDHVPVRLTLEERAWLRQQARRLDPDHPGASIPGAIVDRWEGERDLARLRWFDREAGLQPNQSFAVPGESVVLVGDGSWTLEQDGAMGRTPDPAITHCPECCSSKGCHNVCSHLCGTPDEIRPGHAYGGRKEGEA